MAATPPLQVASSPQTPPTPLHGGAYDRLDRMPTRHSARISKRNSSHEFQSTPQVTKSSPRSKRLVTTPGSSRRVSQNSLPQSPRLTPKHKPNRRVQVISPSSPELHSFQPKPVRTANTHLQPFLSSTTTMSESMLPTPVKTPKKKPVPKVSGTARALFQDQLGDEFEIGPSPRRARKNKRYNGFSLESFSGQDRENRGRVQIFTDSRDKVPDMDTSESNPFIDRPVNEESSSSRRLTGGISKRRKISGETKNDPQVEEAIKNDEGMVYVFRGKKVFRRFEDEEDEEEEIDAEELGLLEHADSTTIKPLTALTRKSIKPTRLFQSEEQKLARQLEKEEEALTDIEEPASNRKHEAVSSEVDVPAPQETEATTPNGRSLRSAAKSSSASNDIDKPKKASPFDSWPRLKAGVRSSASTSKSKKRTASDAAGEEEEDAHETQSAGQKRMRM